MQPVIEKREPFAVLGLQTEIKRGSESPELFSKIWAQFEEYGPEIESRSTNQKYYGIHFPTDKEDVTRYMAAMMVKEDTLVPDGLEKRTVAGSQFAVFECPVEAIGQIYQRIFTEWLQSAQVAYDPSIPVFEEYPEKDSPELVRIHIPIREQT